MSARPAYRGCVAFLSSPSPVSRSKESRTAPERGIICWRAVAAASAVAWLLVGALTLWAMNHRPNPAATALALPFSDLPESSVAVNEADRSEPSAKATEPAAANLQAVSFKKAPASPALSVEEDDERLTREPGLPASELGLSEEVANVRTYGTQVAFVSSPIEAARKALKERKLLFVLHLSGNFEDKKFTWNNAEALRVNALANEQVGNYLNDHFASAFQKVGSFRLVNGKKQGGNVAGYFCLADGSVLHLVAGPVDAATLLREARWVVENRKLAAATSKGDVDRYKTFFRMAHAERLRQERGLDIGSQLPAADVPLADFASRTFQQGGKRPGPASQGVHLLLAAYPLAKIDQVYEVVFEKILGEKISTLPVQGSPRG